VRRVAAFLRIEDLRGADARLLLSLFALVVCVWVFVTIANHVTGGRAQPIDERLMRALRVSGDLSQPVGPRWLPGAVRDVTALGSAPVLVIFVLAVAGALVARRQYHAVLLLLASTVGGILLNEALKGVFGRPRPDTALHLTDVRSLSFPSGHAMESAIIYLTLAALLARLVQPRTLRLYFLAVAALLTLLVGLSRVYLGVHYPSDVLAGWCAGLAWALACWMTAGYLQRRGTVEPPS
jgi:undecaprenyl-diphosphatase